MSEHDLEIDRWVRLQLPPPPPSGSYVYFILCTTPDRHVKIGYARNLAARLSSAQTDCPYELQIVAFIWTEHPASLESTLHSRLRESRIRGEWYALTPGLTDFLLVVRRELHRQWSLILSGQPLTRELPA